MAVSNVWVLTMVAILSVGAGRPQAHLEALHNADCTARSDPAHQNAPHSDGDARLIPISERGTSRRIEGTLVVGAVSVETFRQALSVLPRRPTRILVVGDAAMPPGVAGQVRELDGFVPVGSGTIYLRRESITLREAEMSGGPYILMLAAVIWHEVGHVEGCDEVEAREREAGLWGDFVRSGRVDGALGLSYLAALRRRK